MSDANLWEEDHLLLWAPLICHCVSHELIFYLKLLKLKLKFHFWSFCTVLTVPSRGFQVGFSIYADLGSPPKLLRSKYKCVRKVSQKPIQPELLTRFCKIFSSQRCGGLGQCRWCVDCCSSCWPCQEWINLISSENCSWTNWSKWQFSASWLEDHHQEVRKEHFQQVHFQQSGLGGKAFAIQEIQQELPDEPLQQESWTRRLKHGC